MDKSTLDTLKLREMITLPELPDPMEAVMKQTMDGLHKLFRATGSLVQAAHADR